MAVPEIQAFRVVLMGATGVGKTAVIKRFCSGEFPQKHHETVEDVTGQRYLVNGMPIDVTFLDTAGNSEFPAMKRLNIVTAQAFLLMYSVTDLHSFDTLKELFEEIRQVKSDAHNYPFVFVGNKTDLVDQREVLESEAASWLEKNLTEFNWRLVEASAKDNEHIDEIFEHFVELAHDCGHIVVPKMEPPVVHKISMRMSFPIFRRLSLQVGHEYKADEVDKEDKQKVTPGSLQKEGTLANSVDSIEPVRKTSIFKIESNGSKKTKKNSLNADDGKLKACRMQ